MEGQAGHNIGEGSHSNYRHSQCLRGEDSPISGNEGMEGLCHITFLIKLDPCDDFSRASERSPHHQLDNNPSDQDNVIEELCQNTFMKTPSNKMVNATIGEFIDRTSNAALAIVACVVCARETAARELSQIDLDSLPNRH